MISEILSLGGTSWETHLRNARTIILLVFVLSLPLTKLVHYAINYVHSSVQHIQPPTYDSLTPPSTF